MVVSSLEQFLQSIWLQNPSHLVIEILLIIFIVILVFRKPKPIADPNSELTEQEEEQIIAEWKPKSLVPDEIPSDFDQSILNTPTITSAPTDVIEIDGKTAINFACPNYLGLNMHPEIVEASIDAVNKYAVGACGPRQFYGTMDAHLKLEEDFAKWLGTEDSVGYCYPFATTASVVQAFVRNSDILFIDEGVWFAARIGAQLSKSKVYTFKHNDMENLRQVVESARKTFPTWNKCNRWVVTEGIYTNDGSILDFPALIQARKDFCLRLIIDESNSMGVLGATGKGVCEHFNVPRDLVEVTIGSLGPSLSSLGGFTIGTKEICAHQRLASYAYIFSASPPCFNVLAASKAIELIIKDNGSMINKLRSNTELMRNLLTGIAGLELTGDEISPLIHLRLTKNLPVHQEDELLQEIVDECLNSEKAVAFSKSKFNRVRDITAPLPTIKVFVSAAHSEEQIRAAAATIKRVSEKLVN